MEHEHCFLDLEEDESGIQQHSKWEIINLITPRSRQPGIRISFG